jgi:hypothetical protein
VIVDNLDVESVPVLPLETDTPLLVDPYAVLSLPIAHQPFKLIRGRNHEVAQVGGGVEVFQLLTRSLLYPSVEPLHKLTAKYRLGVLAPEGSDHPMILTLGDINVKR